jgi:hypothetical protein
MRNKIIAVAMALFTIIAMSLTMASPANALMSKSKCRSDGYSTITGGYTITTCVEILYRAQTDGSGWAIEDLYLDINNGCSNLDSPKTYDNNVTVWGTVHVVRTENISNMDCHAYRDLELGVPSGGEAHYTGFQSLDLHDDEAVSIYFNFGTN